MKIESKALTQLTPDEYRACLHLNMRSNGMMMYSLMDQKKNPKAIAVLAKDSDGKMHGWALMVPHADEYQWAPSAYQRRKSKYLTQFYVRKSRRGEGIGTALMEEVKMLDKTPAVIPHDSTSGDFFANHAVVSDSDHRPFINEAKKRKRRKVRAA